MHFKLFLTVLLLLTSGLAWSQTGPGGVNSSLQFWYKANVGVEESIGNPVEDGDIVRYWRDQSGNAFDGYQQDSGERPKYDATNSINYNPVIVFDGTTHIPIEDLNYDLTTNTLSEFTIYSIVKSDQTDEGVIVSYDRSSFFRFSLNHQGNANFGLSTNVDGAPDVIDDNNASSSASDGVTHLIGADYSTTSDIKNLYYDGVVSNNYTGAHGVTGGLIGDPTAVPRFGYIGARSRATTFDGNDRGRGIVGSVAEIIYYERLLLPAERSLIESYLAIKYGVTLSSDYVASDGSTVIWNNTANTGFNNMIAAIALDNSTTLSQPQSKSEVNGAVLSLLDAALIDGDYVAWGNDGAGLDIVTSFTGSLDGRFERIWKIQITGSTTNVDEISIDLSNVIIKPNALGNYRLLVDDNASFSSPNELSAATFTNGIITFTNVDLSGQVYISLALDPDLDNDGIADADDLDDDNDGLLDTDEGSGLTDTDGDGIVDSRDLDSDNDGIGDMYESGVEGSGTALATLDADNNGMIDVGNEGTNGLDDRLETVADNGIIAYTISDADSFGPADFRDLDSDNDGISDLVESGRSTAIDTDDDGIFEGTDSDQDGVPDEVDSNPTTFGALIDALDQDANGEYNFRALDSDADGVEDVDEVNLTDVSPDDGRLDGSIDADGDGILSARDDNDALFGQINLADLTTGSGTDWYSFKSGNWSESNNWTLDPSGTVRINPGGLIPNNLTDNVYILNGDEMTMDLNGVVISSLDIETGGVLDLGTTNNHNFNEITGEGTIELASNNFPGGVTTSFSSTSGGTVIYTDQSPAVDYELSTNRTFNNVIINSAANTIVLKANYTINGDLQVASGSLQINDDTGDAFTDNTTPLTIIVNGNVTVDAAGSISVGDVDAATEINTSGIFTFHQFEVLGNITNNGSIVFTNLSPTSIADARYQDKYPTAADLDNNTGIDDIPSAEYGVVELLLTNGSSNQLVTLNGASDFYRIEVKKGTSQTFTAEINSSTTSNFRLLGRIAMNQSDDSGNSPNIENHRALGLEAGILKLGDNIFIDGIAKDDSNGSAPTTQGGNRNYIIDLDAQLWLASNSQVIKANSWGIHPFGKLKVSDDAVLSFSGTGQRTILVDNEGVFEMTGGTVDITQFRNKTGADGPPRGSFIMTGGTLNIGNSGVDGNHAIFSVPWQDQNFILAASDEANPPVINITLDGNRGKDNAAIQIGVKSGNYNVGISTVNIIHTSGTDYKVVSTAPFYNFNYTNTNTSEILLEEILDSNDDGPGAGGILPDDNSGNTASPAQFALPLIVTNDFTISDGRFDANDLDLTVGNSMTIVDGGEYDPGINTTIFNGTSPIQYIRLNGTTPILGGGFYDIELSTSGTEKEFGGDLAIVNVLNDLTIGTGVTLNDNGKVIEVNGDITNSGLHETDYLSPGRIEVTGGAASHEIGGDGNGQFKVLTIDDAVNAVSFTEDQQIDSVLNLVNGILDIGIHQLTVVSTATNPIRDDASGVSNFDNTRYVRTAGNASDQGISYFIQNDADDYLYPIGTDKESGTDKYTPAVLSILGTSSSNSGYVKINVADAFLPTIDPSETAKLDYYWRFNHKDFTTPPTISLRFNYNDEDITGNETQYNGGYVLDESPFDRVEEDANDDDRNINELIFNGTSNNGAFPGNRFEIINANFSAAGSNAWNGQPEIYYSRAINGNWVIWNDPQNWSSDAINQHLGPGGTGSEYPQDGDIAVIGSVYVDAIGCDPCINSGTGRHQFRIDNTVGNITVAQLIFDSQPNGTALNVTDMSRVHVRGGLTLDAGIVGGRGELVQDVGTVAQTGTIIGDLGDFIEDKNNGFFYWFQSVTDVTISDRFEFPIFRSFGADGRLDFSQDVSAFGIVVDNGTTMSISTNWTIDSLIQVGSNGAGTIEFPNVGSNVTLETETIVFSNNAGNNISVENAGTDVHRFIVNGDIILDQGTGFDLTSAAGAQVELEVSGTGDHSFMNNTGTDAALYRLIVNKGVGQTSTFTFDNNFTLGATSSGTVKPLELQNGTLILNDSNIDIDINGGGGNFTIPATAALDLQAGTIRMTATGSGSGNGMRLNGRLSINGGDVLLDGGIGADNFIEYGTSGGAEIELNSGNLIVGSQLRRSTIASDGVINYTQTGGTALFGVNTAPEDRRGVFEIINTGAAGSSSFNLSGLTSTFAIVNGQTAPDLGTFIIGSDVSVNISNDAIIDFGYNAVVAGITAQNDLNETYQINSAAAIPNIRIDNAGNNSPILEMVIQPLVVSNNLEILNGGSLDANGFDLTINGDFTNNGSFTSGNNETTFNGDVQLISGSTPTTFYNLVSYPTTSLTLNNSILVEGDLEILTGTLDDNGNRIGLMGDLFLWTELVSDGSGNGGLSMEGIASQQIRIPGVGSGTIDKLIIDNGNNVVLKEKGATAVTLIIDDELAIESGLLQVGDNRLIFDHDAIATSTLGFDASRMISVNGVKRSDGVERQFLAGVDAPSFEIPVGTPDKYTPVILDVDASDDPGSILVKPINSIHPSATGPDALNYYWKVTTTPSSVSNFSGNITFQYLEEDANNAGQNESTWENNAVRLLVPSWFKPSGNLVDISLNTITFNDANLSAGGTTTFDGEYTVGNDIPNLLSTFQSNSTANWNAASTWDIDRDGDGLFDEINGDDDPLNQIPQPGTIVLIRSSDVVSMSSTTDNDQNIFSVDIEGTLDVGDSDGHNFGDVTGSGILQLASGTIPGGNFDAFFTTSGGSIELAGTNDYTISPDFTNVRGLFISGGGIKTLPTNDLNIGVGGISIQDGATLNNATNNNSITVSGNIDVINGTFLLGSAAASLSGQDLTLTSGTVTSAGAGIDLSGDLNLTGGTFNASSANHTIAGDFNYNTAATFNRSSSTVVFDGSTNQNINSNASSTIDFHNLSLNKSNGQLIIDGNSTVQVNNQLGLVGGSIINTLTTGSQLRLIGTARYGSSPNGYINGPLFKDLQAAASAFTFRIGNATRYKPVTIDPQAGSYVGTLTWEAQYYEASADTYSSAENNGIDLSLIETNLDPDEQVIELNPYEFWRVDSGGGSANLDAISIDVSGLGITTNDINDQLLQVMFWDQAGNEWDHLGGITSGTPSNGNVTSTGTLSFSEKIVLLGAENSAVLPVELLYFQGIANNNRVLLDWATVSEINNDYFDVQRSSDGYEFETIGRVGGSGNSNELIEYSFTDTKPMLGLNYYRLRQVDYDGTEEFLPVIQVDNDFLQKGVSVTMYPNPTVQNNLNLRILSGDNHTPFEVRIVNLFGQVFYQNSFEGQLTVDERITPLSTMKTGIYFLIVQQGNSISKSKIIIE